MIDYYADMFGSLDSADFYDKSYTSNHTFTNRQVDAYRSKLALNHYWNNRTKSTVTGYFRNNSIKQNPAYRVKDDFKPWMGIGDPSLAHGELNDNSFKSFGFVAQHKQGLNFLNGNFIIGGSIDNSPNTYKANYIRIHKTDDGIYDSYESTDSMLANYSAHLLNTAIYSQIKLEPIKNLSVVAAIRYDRFNYSFDNHLGANAYTSVLDGENTYSQITPKIGATYQLFKTSGIYTNYSKGFVPPQVGELYRGNEVPTLAPVYYDNYEVGGWTSFAKGKGKIEMSIYQMDGLNEIITILQDNGSSIKKNAGKTTHQGIEYGVNVMIHKDLRIQFSGTNAIHKFVAFAEAGNNYSGNEMPQAPQLMTNAVITYKPSALKGLRTSIEWRHMDDYFMEQQNTKRYSGYNIYNFRIGYEWKAFEVWTNVMNLTDKLYSTVARASTWGDSYSLGKPRNFNIGLVYHLEKNTK